MLGTKQSETSNQLPSCLISSNDWVGSTQILKPFSLCISCILCEIGLGAPITKGIRGLPEEGNTNEKLSIFGDPKSFMQLSLVIGHLGNKVK